jgi:hypothetical protein
VNFLCMVLCLRSACRIQKNNGLNRSLSTLDPVQAGICITVYVFRVIARKRDVVKVVATLTTLPRLENKLPQSTKKKRRLQEGSAS